MAAAGMMQVKGNEQLTVELAQLASRVEGLADQPEGIMPEVRDKIMELCHD